MRAGRGQTAVTGRWDGLLKQTIRISDAECQKSVIAGRESGSWAAGRDGLLGWTFETRLPCADCFKSQSEWAVGGGPWTDVRDGPLGWTLGWTFETNGTASCADYFKSQSERAVGAGRGRTSVTGRWDGLLKQTARLPCADCFRSQSA